MPVLFASREPRAAACSPAVPNILGVVISLLSLYLYLWSWEVYPHPPRYAAGRGGGEGGDGYLASFLLLWLPCLLPECLSEFIIQDRGGCSGFKKNGSPGTKWIPARCVCRRAEVGRISLPFQGPPMCLRASCSPASHTVLRIMIYSFVNR